MHALKNFRHRFAGCGRMLWMPLFIILCVGCEEVIDVDVADEAPRLVVDALIRVDTTEVVFPVRVAVRETAGFFGQPPVTGLKQITISNEAGAYAVLLENPEGSGVYEADISLPFVQDGGELILQIEHKDQRYLARTKYVESVPIDSLVQGEETLFEGDETEVIVSFTDKEGQDNFYLLDFDLNQYLVTEDEFYKGQQFSFSYFYENEIESGQELEVAILGVDRSFYNYMNQLIIQSEESLGPFQTPVATVRGNIINVTEIDNRDYFDNVFQPNNFALGYFAVCQVFTKNITIEAR